MSDRYGITFPFDGIPLLEQRPVIESLPDLGYTDLWSAESGGYDAFIPLALGAAWAPSSGSAPRSCPRLHARAGTRWRRRPRRCARPRPAASRSGIGTSSNVIVERWNGMTFDKPYQRVRDTIRFLRGGARRREGHRGLRDVRGQRLPARHSRRPEQPPILVAALRQGMLRLAGREGDGAIINWLSADDVKTVAPHVERRRQGDRGADLRAPDRRPGPGPRGRQVRDRVVPHRAGVRAFHEWLGAGPSCMQPMRDAWKEGDRKAARRRSPTRSSTSCSCGARRSSAASTSSATSTTASPRPVSRAAGRRRRGDRRARDWRQRT